MPGPPRSVLIDMGGGVHTAETVTGDSREGGEWEGTRCSGVMESGEGGPLAEELL